MTDALDYAAMKAEEDCVLLGSVHLYSSCVQEKTWFKPYW